MGIFESFDSILDLLGHSSSQDMEAIAGTAGLDKSKTGAIIGMGLPMILDAMAKNNQKEGGLDSFANAINQHAQGPDYSSVEEYVQKVDQEDGDKMLGHVFDNKQGIIERIADTLGLEPAAVKRVLILLAPLVLKQLASNAKNKNLDHDGIKNETDAALEQVKGSLKDFGQKVQLPKQEVPQVPQVPQGNGSMLEDILGGLVNAGLQGQSKQQSGGLLLDLLKGFLN